MFLIHEKEANSVLTKSGLKHLVAVTPSFFQYSSLMKRFKMIFDTVYLDTCTCIRRYSFMRNDKVLIRVLYVVHDAAYFFALCILVLSSTTIR